MGAAIIPIILAICTVFLGLVSGWNPFGHGLVAVVVLGLFAFMVGGLIKLIGQLEPPEH